MSASKLFFGVFVVFCIILSAKALDSTKYPKLQFILVDSSNTTNKANFLLNETTKIQSHRYFRQLRETIVYSFGYTETKDSPLLKELLKAIEKNGRYNFIIVDYGDYSSSHLGPPSLPDYLQAIENIKEIGPLVGKALWNGFGARLLVDFQLVGHSLGSHLCGYINRAIAAANKYRVNIPIIIGLDPAAPVFYPFGNSTTMNQPLNSNDANVVYVIHTDKMHAGAPVHIGTIDFWPNDGIQTGCPPFDIANILTNLNNYCAHQRSVLYYAEALANPSFSTFSAAKCASWDAFKKGNCNYFPFFLASMGRDPFRKLTGDYYLQTASTSPFSLGLKGLRYDDKLH